MGRKMHSTKQKQAEGKHINIANTVEMFINYRGAQPIARSVQGAGK